ncbi:hypothetical protein [Streptomyces sp. SID14478]|nr:hypothetical protein [Streptomyces sp. SID14478]
MLSRRAGPSPNAVSSAVRSGTVIVVAGAVLALAPPPGPPATGR